MKLCLVGGARFVSSALIVTAFLAVGQPATGQVIRQLTDIKTSDTGTGALDDAGTVVYATSCADPFGANARHAYQIMKWNAVTGTGSQLTSYADGVAQGQDVSAWSGAYSVSVSDDGQWVAFISSANLVGLNHDESPELYVMMTDGTQISQLTSDTAVNAYSVQSVVLSGSGNRVAFVADIDPFGTNEDHIQQLWDVDRAGTNLRQLTNIENGMTFFLPGFFDIAISDDGTKIAFSNQANLTGGNVDGTSEIFGINHDGTGLHQITASFFHSTHPALSGDGNKIAYETQGNVTAINWDGTGKLTLTAGNHPSITDDGQFVVLSSNQGDVTNNPDLNNEIWKIKSDATGKVVLTNTLAPTQNLEPVISGTGGRIAFLSPAATPPATQVYYRKPHVLKVMNGTGGELLTLSTQTAGEQYWPVMTPDGTRVVFVSTSNLLGTDPERNGEIYRMEADGTGLAQVTSLTDGDAQHPTVASDRDTIVFSSTANPLGTNAAHAQQIFKVKADGTSLVQLTSAAGCGVAKNPHIAAGGSFVVFESCANLTGGNSDLSNEIFRVAPGGTSLLQVTNDPGEDDRKPRVDDAGALVVFQTESDLDGGNVDGSSEIYRIGTGGTGLLRITTDMNFDSLEPDISGSGARIVYASNANPVGANADHNYEIFSYDPATATRRQLTNTGGGDCRSPRISRDGFWVYFKSNAPIFETTPGHPWQPYIVEVLTADIDRVGGMRHGSGADMLDASIASSGLVATNTDGKRAVFAAAGDWIDRNPDFNYELYFVDLVGTPKITVSKSTPTLVTIDPEPYGLRYDFIRGDRVELGPIVAGHVDLGPVVCLENDSPDTDILGFEDATAPPVGKTYFFLARAQQGLTNPGNYGKGSSGALRDQATGDCAP